MTIIAKKLMGGGEYHKFSPWGGACVCNIYRMGGGSYD